MPTYNETIISSEFDGENTILWLLHDPTINGTIGSDPGDVGGFKLGFTYEPMQWTNGPSGEQNYIDDVWSFGSNIGVNTGRIDTTKASLGLTFESKFFSSNVFAHEFHLQGQTASGSAYRPMSYFVAYDGSLILGAFTGHQFTFYSASGAQRIQFNDATAALFISDIAIKFSTNNASAIQQKNSSGSAYIDILKLDAGDIAVVAAPLYVVGPRAGELADLPGVFAAFQPTTANSGDTMLALVGPNMTGSLCGMRAEATVSGTLQNMLVNDGTGSGAHAQTFIGTSGGSGGNPFLTFDVPGVADFSIGIDNFDNDKFKISRASSLGNNDAIAIDTGLNTVASGALTSKSPSSGIGYSAGAGGAVTQNNSKATGVTINKVAGAITTNDAALADATNVKFTIQNSAVAATDVVVVNHASGGTTGAYQVWVSAVATGSFDISIRNVSGGTLSEAIVINFALIKAVAA